eukprot:15181007-Alexandrium_andersonii.AAC.1
MPEANHANRRGVDVRGVPEPLPIPPGLAANDAPHRGIPPWLLRRLASTAHAGAANAARPAGRRDAG